jgi:enterochelin esterase-like enzyme
MALPREGPAAGLVVSLHGRDGDADSAFDLGLADHVDRTRLAVVSVDGGNGYWHARRDGSDTGAMVREDLIPLALARAGLPATAGLVLHGWSMGGFGALLLASDLGADRVKAVVAVSAALWTAGSETPAGAYDDREDFERHSIFGRAEALRRVPVRLDCGTSDPFIRANRLLATKLPRAVADFGPGGHDAGYWRSHLADELDWAAAR